MRYRITHSTSYQYASSIGLCHNLACLLPRTTPNQQVVSSYLQITPRAASIDEWTDFFGNRRHHFAIQRAHQDLTVTAHSEVVIRPVPFPGLLQTTRWVEARDDMLHDLSPAGLEARTYILPSPYIAPTPAIRAFAEGSFQPNATVLEAMLDLNHRIFSEFTYDPHFTTVVTPLEEVLQHRRGVCQDFAHLAIACVRAMGIPARYVSGYLETLPPPGQEKLQGADASHAWLSVYDPILGWIDFDPTNDQIPSHQHITIAWGRDYSDVSPLKGIFFGVSEQQLRVAVDVNRVGD